MKKDIRDRWMTALRSGKYEQGLGRLRYSGNGVPKYCCLGVLCDILPEYGIWTDYGRFATKTEFLENVISPLMGRELGLDVDAQNHLIDLNDQELYSFERIARWIETNIPEEV